jgi:hypothetical protein
MTHFAAQVFSVLERREIPGNRSDHTRRVKLSTSLVIGPGVKKLKYAGNADGVSSWQSGDFTVDSWWKSVSFGVKTAPIRLSWAGRTAAL